MEFSSSQLGHFLKYRHWENAIALLQGQISQIDENKFFNTLSLFHYQKLDLGEILNKEYFEQKIASSLFYGLKKEFLALPYLVPKRNGGNRSYKFLTAPLRLTYYATLLYIFEISQTLITDLKEPHIHNFYGGRVTLDKKGGIIVSPDNIYYRNNHQSFKKRATYEATHNNNNKVILELDIQNFFEDISLPNFMDILEQHLKPSDIQKYKFDEATKQQIASLFKYIALGKEGFPQIDNDVLASFASNLYLMFGDTFIDIEIKHKNELVEDYQIIRYVDDYKLYVQFKDGVEKSEKDEFVASLFPRISDTLYFNLGLKLNQKTSLYFLDKVEEIIAYINSLKLTSHSEMEALYESMVEAIDENGNEENAEDKKSDDENPEEILEDILDVLEKLKSSPLDPLMQYKEIIPDNSIFSALFDPRVSELVNREDFTQKINILFEDFNFELLKLYPKALISLVFLSEENSDRLLNYLLAKENINTQDINLIIVYLCQTGFRNKLLFGKLKTTTYFSDIIPILESAILLPDMPGYFSLSNTQCLNLVENDGSIEQTRLRVLSEQSNSYTVALNHLLNEIHAITWKLDPKNKRDYKADDVIRFLRSKDVPRNISIQIRNLFDRRNTNTVSHPGSDYYLSSGVTKKEYWGYYDFVGKTLGYIL